jgi:hypothetical protein
MRVNLVHGQAIVSLKDCAVVPLQVSWTSWVLSAVEPFGTVRHLVLKRLTKWKVPLPSETASLDESLVPGPFRCGTL